MHDGHHHDHHQAAAARVSFGFWMFLMTDCISFAVLFATYIVLNKHAADISHVISLVGGLPMVMKQSLVLLTTAFIAGLSAHRLAIGEKGRAAFYLLATLVLAGAFVFVEWQQLGAVIQSRAKDVAPYNGFYSAFVVFIGIHLAHVVVGFLWGVVLLVQLKMQGATQTMRTRFTCLSLFWSFINIIWILIFTIVYLMGAMHVI
jgi:cytochrome o ubiquinol oxidase subunit III